MSTSKLGKGLAAVVAAALLLALTACGDAQAPAQPAAAAPVAAAAPADTRPNLLLIIADDLGYTDIGVFGGEISTPNLDALARDGIILRDFQTNAVCAATRATILSGTTHHNAGGKQHVAPNQVGLPGYETHMNENVVSFPSLLQRAGYHTYFAGKWHLGNTPERLPVARGFDKSFGLMQGGASHYEDARGMREWMREGSYFEEYERVTQLPAGFYSTTFYTDFIIDAIDANAASGQPWYSHLAYTAPHWPLHAPDEYIEKYRGMYDEGYEALREQRVNRAKALGIFPETAVTSQQLDMVPAWDSLTDEQKAFESRKMEIHAAMVELLDEDVGRLIDHLKAIGQYDNTLIMFISDNGAEGQYRDPFDNGTDWVHDNSIENIGRMGSNVTIGPGWAQAQSGVLRYYKSMSSEGGTRTSAFFHHPDLSKKGVVSDSYVSILDIAPTFLELAGVSYPTYGDDGRILPELQGVSLVPMLLGDEDSVRPDDFTAGFELFGHISVRKGDWKLLWLTSRPAEVTQPPTEGADQWGLYNLALDPGETNDLSAQHPERVAELLAVWDQYVIDNGVVLPILETPAP